MGRSFIPNPLVVFPRNFYGIFYSYLGNGGDTVQFKIYRLFLEFLWKRKYQSFIYPLLYQYRKSVLTVTKALVYIGLLTLWGEVFQEIPNNAIFSVVY